MPPKKPVKRANEKSPQPGSTRKPSAKKTPATVAAGGLKPRAEKPERGFPIVGIGASAGGLEALEELFAKMPTDTGMAFIVITHQHPGHTSLLPELLGKITELKVITADDGMKVEPNHVYVSPPGGYLALLHGTLHRMESETKTAPHLPIDSFFRSLAEDQKERAIGITGP